MDGFQTGGGVDRHCYKEHEEALKHENLKVGAYSVEFAPVLAPLCIAVILFFAVIANGDVGSKTDSPQGNEECD